MAKLTRRESEQRRQAMLNFWLQNPTATGDEAQRALTSGQLTGQKGPPLAIGTVYELRKQALGLGRAPARVPVAQVELGPALEGVRAAALALQRALAKLPDVSMVTVSRDEVRVARTTTVEEAL